MHFKICLLVFLSSTLADVSSTLAADNEDYLVTEVSTLDQLAEQFDSKYLKDSSDYNVKQQSTKKNMITAMSISILSSKGNKEYRLDISDNDKVPICLPESLKRWKEENKYEKTEEKYCKKKSKGLFRGKGMISVEKYVLSEVTPEVKGSFRSKKLKKMSAKDKQKLWDDLDKICKDPKQPWSKFKRGENPGTFDEKFQKAVKGLTKLMIEEKLSDQFLSKLYFFKTHKHINEVVFKRAATRALLIRKDTTNDVTSPLETALEEFCGNKDRQNKYGSDYQMAGLRNQEEDINIPADSNPLEASDPDTKLNYWREDLLLHVFHDLWHTISNVAHPKSRRGERFTFAHNEVLKRYFIEREILDLPPVTCEKGNEMYNSFAGQYHPQLWANRYQNRHKDCKLTKKGVDKMESMKNKTISRIKKSTFEKYGRFLERLYHNIGHTILGKDCKEDKSKRRNAILDYSAGSARDPLFYLWHCEVQRVARLAIDQLPKYEKKDVALDGIEITRLWVETNDGKKNNLMTFMEETSLEHYNKFKITYTRQNHERFQTKFVLKNSQKKQKRVIIRIFLGLSGKGQTAEAFRKMILMDRFVRVLSGTETEEVVRSSRSSAITMKESGMTLYQMTENMKNGNSVGPKPFCGFPHNLFLPRGKDGGQAYELAVVVSDVDKKVNEGLDGVEHVMCGHNSPKTVVDKRSFGFPFDRPWNFQLKDVEGSIKFQKIMIHHDKKKIKKSTSGLDNLNKTDFEESTIESASKIVTTDAPEDKESEESEETEEEGFTDGLDVLVNQFTTDEPETTTKETEATTEETEVGNKETESTTETEVTSEKMEVTSEEMEAPTKEMEASTVKAEADTRFRKVVTVETEIATEQKEVATEEMEAPTEEMEDTTADTNVISEEIDITSKEREVTTAEIGDNSRETEVTNEEMGVTTEKMQVTTNEMDVTDNLLSKGGSSRGETCSFEDTRPEKCETMKTNCNADGYLGDLFKSVCQKTCNCGGSAH